MMDGRFQGSSASSSGEGKEGLMEVLGWERVMEGDRGLGALKKDGRHF